jgi:hypothetical protein
MHHLIRQILDARSKARLVGILFGSFLLVTALLKFSTPPPTHTHTQLAAGRPMDWNLL